MKGYILDSDTWIEFMIAVTARHYGLTVVTHNIKHFSKMPGVNCVDWVESK